MTPHDKIVSALTQWDIKNKNKKGYNSYFIGIALNALKDIEEEMPHATPQEWAKEAFNGRVLDFVLKFLAE